ncbi:hypothetical protein O6P43_035133 [Quillaja saponaria]|uniref:Uncharacterized protein n=1 Tax=Quillaja saponaria TaxID=32244 RepID=A0AAD7P4C4_QUISA|nr:hypothetical protein O6P43_035133 [Quillaja saponaria]
MQVAPEGTYAWVSRIVALTPLHSPFKGVVEGVQGWTLASREPWLAAGPNKSPRWQAPRHSVVEFRSRPVKSAFCRPRTAYRTLLRCARNTIEATPGQAGYLLNLSISISGGKETYKDSPSNGERTGKSPP